jgi:CubicO group peptidase (beta-lactamase class C family)
MGRFWSLCRLGVAAAVLAFAPAAQAQSGRASTSEAAQLNRLFEGWGDRRNAPGSSVLVIRTGVVVYERTEGLADLANNVPITPDTRFYIGSVSKQFTAACIALLAERGRLSLDDGLRRHVPELPAVYDGVTIRHLIHHTSGMRDFQTLLDTTGRTDDVNTPQDIIALMARQRALRFAPGSRYEYNNTGYFFLAVIIERVSGLSLRAFAQENIFAPLGMTSTEFYDDRSRVIPHFATGYAPRRGGGYAQYRTNYDLVGAGGVVTTARDLARWDANFYNNRLGGGGALIRQLTAPAKLANGDDLDYGYGIELGERRGLRIAHHDGGFAGFVAEMLRFPEQRFTVIYLTNERGSIDAKARAFEIADIYLASQLRPETARTEEPARPQRPSGAPPSPPADLAAFAGEYYSDELDAAYRFVLEGGQLKVKFRHVIDAPLAPAGGDDFRIYGALPVHFARDARGRVVSVTPQAGGARDIVFTRR